MENRYQELLDEQKEKLSHSVGISASIVVLGCLVSIEYFYEHDFLKGNFLIRFLCFLADSMLYAVGSVFVLAVPYVAAYLIYREKIFKHREDNKLMYWLRILGMLVSFVFACFIILRAY